MNKNINIFVGILIFLGLFVFSEALYTIDETQQVIITQFGEPKGDSKTKAGLYLKIPFVQKVNYFEKRILQWDGKPNQIPTREKRYIWVDTTARWRISDVLKFMQSVRTEASAHARLDDIVDAATRDVISSHNLVEAVRDSNRMLDTEKEAMVDDPGFAIGRTALDAIEVGRENLNKEILLRASKVVPKYGIELIDVRIKRINYVREVRDKVYDRMISERRRAAEQFRSEGKGEQAEIEGQRAKNLERINSKAYRRAQEIKGAADAKAIKIYADAYNKDPEFYAFTKTLEGYKKTIGKSTTLMLTTDNDFYEHLKGTDFKGKVTAH